MNKLQFFFDWLLDEVLNTDPEGGISNIQKGETVWSGEVKIENDRFCIVVTEIKE